MTTMQSDRTTTQKALVRNVFCKQEIPKNAKKNPQWGVGKNGVMQ